MDRAPPGSRRLDLSYTLRSLTNPRDAYARIVQKSGDPCWLQTVVGPVVVTGDPEGVRAIFAADPDSFEYYAPEMEAPLFGETALVFATGEQHRSDRKLISPAFAPARMKAYGRAMADIAARQAAAWEPDRPFDMLASALSISLEALLQAIVGLREPTTIERAGAATLRLSAAVTPTLLFFPALRRRFYGLGPYARFLRASDEVDSILREQIDERRRSSNGGEDILSLMTRARYEDGTPMSDKKIRDELRVLLFAGHETTAIAIAWALYWIHREPSVRERLLGELAALGPSPEPEAIVALPYLDAVCQETLRLHPIIPEIVRMLRRPLALKGFSVPAGVGVLAAATLLHDREDLYPEPRRFLPDRFLQRKFTPFEFMPFGGGAHRCLGAGLAVFEMKVVIGALLRACELTLAGTEPIEPVRRGVTMGPRGGVPMRVVRRL
ncbi:MAG TPA: cytochrome P450 [Polyangiaceae bacterium]|jgi:cytochrome P450|nr:cytochrome P450 [Polyangiaceae bacterium]